jgi:hypothetical protein
MTPLSSEETQRMQRELDRVCSRIRALEAVEDTTQPGSILKEAGQLQFDCQSIQTRAGCIRTHPFVGDEPVAPPKEVWQICQDAARLETKATRLMNRSEQRMGVGRPPMK